MLIKQSFFLFPQRIMDLDDLPMLPLHSSFGRGIDTGKEKISTAISVLFHTSHHGVILIWVERNNKLSLLVFIKFVVRNVRRRCAVTGTFDGLVILLLSLLFFCIFRFFQFVFRLNFNDVLRRKGKTFAK